MYSGPIGVYASAKNTGSIAAAGEPSHGRGAPEVPEPLTSGAQYQYLTRYSTWKKIVRATRSALLCASPKTDIRPNFSSQQLVPYKGNSVGQKCEGVTY